MAKTIFEEMAALMYGKGIILSPALFCQPKKETSLSAYGDSDTNATCKSIKEQPMLPCSQAES